MIRSTYEFQLWLIDIGCDENNNRYAKWRIVWCDENNDPINGGNAKLCPECQGSGEMRCPACNGSGSAHNCDCIVCDATKSVLCQTCNGTGLIRRK